MSARADAAAGGGRDGRALQQPLHLGGACMRWPLPCSAAACSSSERLIFANSRASSSPLAAKTRCLFAARLLLGRPLLGLRARRLLLQGATASADVMVGRRQAEGKLLTGLGWSVRAQQRACSLISAAAARGAHT